MLEASFGQLAHFTLTCDSIVTAKVPGAYYQDVTFKKNVPERTVLLWGYIT